VHNLRSAEWAGGQPLLGAASCSAGFYLNELLLKLLARQDPHPGLFDAYADALAALAGGEDGRPRCCVPLNFNCCANWACCPTWPVPR
jgi:DNA repair protein RecO (recombination protein O)